jgi:hypothetical protein
MKQSVNPVKTKTTSNHDEEAMASSPYGKYKMNNFRDMINAIAKSVVNETERQFTNEQVPGWYMLDVSTGEIADGPYDTKEQAQESSGLASEMAQYWTGRKWSTVDSYPEEHYQMLPDGTKVTIKIGNVDQGKTGVIQGEDESDPDAGTEWARYRISFPDGGHVYKKKHQFNVVGIEEGVMEAPAGKTPNPDNLGALASYISREFAATAADCQKYASQDRSYGIGGNFNAASSGKVVIDRNVHMPGSYNTSTYFNEVLKVGTSIKGAKPLDIIRDLFQKISEKAKVYGLEKRNVSHDALYFDVGVATMQVMYEVGSNYMWIGYNWLSKAKTESVSEASDHDHTDDCEVCNQDLMELPDIEDGIIEGVDDLEEGFFDKTTSKYFPEATNLDDAHAVDMAWEWIQVDIKDNPQADESDIHRFALSTQQEKGLSDNDTQFIRLQAEELAARNKPMDEDLNHMGEHEFQSFGAWRAACKKRSPDVWFDGDRDIANAMVGPNPYIQGETISMGEWDGEVGVIYAPMHEATVDRNKNIKQNQPADLMAEITAKDENGEDMDATEVSRLKQLAGLK